MPTRGNFLGPGGNGNLEWFWRKRMIYKRDETPRIPNTNPLKWSEIMAAGVNGTSVARAIAKMAPCTWLPRFGGHVKLIPIGSSLAHLKLGSYAFFLDTPPVARLSASST